VAPEARALPARDIAGVALHPWQLQEADVRERMFAGVAATGVRRVRVDMPWSWVERESPTVHSGHGDWATIDAIVNAAHRHGLALIPVLGFTPRWASPTGEAWAFPYAAPFEAFFAAALRRYPQIPAWELWNEPNFERFAKPQPDPAGFVEFLRSARRARDAVGSTAKLISGGLAPAGGIDVVTWVNEVAARGGLQLIDGLGIHPYSVAEPDDPRAWMMQLEALHQHLADLGRPDLPLWLTEFGAPTVGFPNGYAPPMTEPQQADRLRTAFALATRFDWIENLTWYEYRDSCREPDDAECHFGLVRADLSPKPSYDAFRDVIAGATVKLRPRLTLTTRARAVRVRARAAHRRASTRRGSAKRRRATRRAAKRRALKRRTVTRISVSGKLMLPGTPAPYGVVIAFLPTRRGPPRAVPVPVIAGVISSRFQGRDLRAGPVEVRYPGSDSYQPHTVQVHPMTAAARR
jgi:polysaccharide biosynthesis protein PslG